MWFSELHPSLDRLPLAEGLVLTVKRKYAPPPHLYLTKKLSLLRLENLIFLADSQVPLWGVGKISFQFISIPLEIKIEV